MASTAITGALRSTPTDLLDAHAGILLMELALLKACHRVMIRLLTLSETHPLNKKIRKVKRSLPRSHLSLIDNLIKLFQLSDANMELISPDTDDPSQPPQFKTHISKSRDKSIEEESKDKADFKIFADGSNHNGGVGVAAVMYEKGCPHLLKHLKARIEDSTEHGSYKVGVVGA